MVFENHFSRVAGAYARFRPRYPEALFAALAERAPSRKLAWDCGTGNGQAAEGLAAHFEEVVATDASAAQIAEARPHPRIHYRVTCAEGSGLADSSVDLITVAQAVHWFDRPAFYREAERVLVPRGVLAVWCYGRLRMESPLDEMLVRFHQETVGPYWSPERTLVEEGYRSLEFPFEEFALPSFSVEKPMTIKELGGFLRTWSAVQCFIDQRGFDPVERFLRALERAWGPVDQPRIMHWPLHVRAGERRPGRC